MPRSDFVVRFPFQQIALEFANWMFGAYISVWRYRFNLFSFSSPEEIVDFLLGERVPKIEDDPNFFFGVWISAVTAILLVTNGCKASMITTDWLLFAVASAALLFSSRKNTVKDEYIENDTFIRCDGEFAIPCEKLIFAKYLGLISLCLCLLMAVLYRLGPTLHVIISIPLMIAWSYGVFYVTFSDTQSAPAIIYFAFWGGVLLSLEIASINFIRFKRRHGERKTSLNENENDDDIESLSIKRSNSDVSDPSSRLVNTDSNFQSGENCDDTEGLVESIPFSIENHDDDIEAHNLRHSLPLWMETFDDENQDEISTDTSRSMQNQKDLESNISDGQGHDKRSVESSDVLDSNVIDGIQGRDNVYDKTDMKIDVSQSKIEITLFDEGHVESVEKIVSNVNNGIQNRKNNDDETDMVIDVSQSKIEMELFDEGYVESDHKIDSNVNDENNHEVTDMTIDVSQSKMESTLFDEGYVESEKSIDSHANDGIQDQDNIQEELDMIIDFSQTKMESTLLDTTMRQRGVSVDTNDFIDCEQFDVSSPEFFSARSSVTRSRGEPHS